MNFKCRKKLIEEILTIYLTTHVHTDRGFGVVKYCGSDEPQGPDLHL